MNNFRQCIMIKTKDNRSFLTPKKNLKNLFPFAKIFEAKFSLVKAKNSDILDLEELAPALCNKDYCSNLKEIKIIKKIKV